MQVTFTYIVLFILLFSSTEGQTQHWEWQTSIGTSIDDDADRTFEQFVALDSKGNIYVAGHFSDTLSFLGTLYPSFPGTKTKEVDMFLAKYAQTGEPLWIRTFGSTGADYVKGVIIDDNDNIHVTGYFAYPLHIGDTLVLSKAGYDSFIAEYSSDGQFTSVKRFGGSNNVHPTDIAYDGNNIFITGTHSGPYFYYEGLELKDKSFFILKIREDGSPNWVTNLPNNDAYIQPSSITPDYSGGCYLTARIFQIVIGSDTLVPTGVKHDALIHVNAEGIADWVQMVYNVEITSVAATPNSVCVLGNFRDSLAIDGITYPSLLAQKSLRSVFIAEYTNNGTLKNVLLAGGRGGESQYGYDICADSVGRFVITGTYTGSIILGNAQDSSIKRMSSFVARIDSSNNVSILHSATSQNSCFLTSVASNVANSIVATGFFRDTVIFDEKVLTSISSDPDVVLAKIGTPLSVSKYSPQDKAKSFPNPSTNFIRINYLIPSPSPITITLHDILGREVLRREMGVQSEGEHEESLDVSELPIGSYIVKISTNQEVFTSRISVVR